eukprot:TRINITY_DN109605_c0_g1_i1.p1 TRINITY_DN109605_c0_g1~~TRINITY_DN109605_c0_g1_i1.p1  ORF type:complete len:925 (-),score=159.07 TRINITY_DN109605_c0_g1_i1:24-2798(-)
MPSLRDAWRACRLTVLCFVLASGIWVDIAGHWQSDGGPSRFPLEHLEDAEAESDSVTSRTVYSLHCLEACWWSIGVCVVGSGEERFVLKCKLDFNSNEFTGRLALGSETVIEWDPDRQTGVREVWRQSPKVPQPRVVPRGRLHQSVRKVHLVFADLQSDGTDEFAKLRHLTELAEEAESHREEGPLLSFVTQPWLLEHFLHCPCPEAPSACEARSLGRNVNGSQVQCPSSEEIFRLEAALRRGNVLWNAGPLAAEADGISPELFQAGLKLAERLDVTYRGRRTARTFFSQAYPTRGIVPLLRHEGVVGLVVASKSMAELRLDVQVPKLHRWIDRESHTDLLVAYLPFGDLQQSMPSCAEGPNGVALCACFRTPSSLREVRRAKEKASSAYPGAQVIVSDFNDFMVDVLPSKFTLPVVTGEVGGTTPCRGNSDPLRESQSRALQRVWRECSLSGKPECRPEDPAIANMTSFLLKATSVLTSPDDARMFNNLAIKALEESGHPLAETVRAAINTSDTPALPAASLGGERRAPYTTPVELGDRKAFLFFGEDGAITGIAHKGVAWASSEFPLASFVYRAGLAEAGEWRPVLSELWIHPQSSGAAALLSMPEESRSHGRGAPKAILLNVSLLQARGGDASSLDLSLEVVLVGKRRASVPETSLLAFWLPPHLDGIPTIERKLLSLEAANTSAERMTQAYAWTLSKLDREVAVEEGARCCQEVWGPVTASTTTGDFRLESLDTGSVRLLTGRSSFEEVKDARDVKSGEQVLGVAFVLHSSAPWSPDAGNSSFDESTLRFRFSMSLGGAASRPRPTNLASGGRGSPAMSAASLRVIHDAGLAIIFLGAFALLLGMRALHGDENPRLLDLEQDLQEATLTNSLREPRAMRNIELIRHLELLRRSSARSQGFAGSRLGLRSAESHLELGRIL